MTLTHSAPAPIAAVLDLYAASVPMKPINVKAAIYQHARSDSEIWHLDGQSIAAAMYFPLPAERPGERLVELAFVCRPELSGHMLAFIRQSHLTRGRLAKDGVRVRAHIRTGHLPGQRMARLLGFRLMLVGTDSRYERWEFDHERFRPGRQNAVHRA